MRDDGRDSALLVERRRADVAAARPAGGGRGRGARVLAWMVPLAVGAVVTPFLAHKSLGLDDAFSAALVRLDAGAFWERITDDQANMLLYHLLLRPWSRLGESDATLRTLSLLFSVAALPFVRLVAERLYGPRAGLVAMVLMAVNGFYVTFALEVRSYALVILLVSAATWLFVTAVERPTARRWATYTLVAAAAVYAHYFAALAVAAHAASLVALPGRAVPRRLLAASAAGLGLLLAPLALLARGGTGTIDWIEPPTLETLAIVVDELTGDGSPALIAAYGAACAAAAWLTLGRVRTNGRSRDTWLSVVAPVGFALPLAVTLAVSLVKPVLVPRYLVVALPSLVVTAAGGVARLRQTGRQVLATVVVVALALPGTAAALTEDYEDWDGAAATVAAQGRAGDGILFYVPYVRTPFEHYWRASGAPPSPAPVYPVRAWGVARPERPFSEPVALAAVDAASRRHARLWVVLAHDRDARPGTVARRDRLIDAVEGRYRLVSERRLTRVRLLLFER